MKSNNYIYAILVILLVFSSSLKAQLNSNYTFSTATVTYTANASPTTLTDYLSTPMATYCYDTYSQVTNIGFTFTYNCTNYTQFSVSANGWMTLGTGQNNYLTTNNLTTTSQGPILAPLWDAVMTSNAAGSCINYKLTGSAPNRVLTVEWKNMLWDYNHTPDTDVMISFQVKLYETSNTVEFCYSQGATAVANGSGGASIGISSGSSSTDFYSLNGTGSSPTASYGTQTSNLATKPATNQVYRWTYSPGAMTYTSCTTVQSNTTGITKCDIDADVICVQVVMGGGCGSSISLTQFQLGAGSSTNLAADASTIHIYYTGTTNTFSTTNEFVAGGTTVSGATHTINGSQALSMGTNYFWISYDVNTAATTANVLDASCTQITVDGVNRVPTATNPAGTRTIAACSSYPGTSATGLKHWVKSDAGVTLTTGKVSAWGDQSGAGITGNLAQATAAARPVVSSAAVNYQDYIYFDGTDDALISANAFTGITSGMYHATDNSIFMVKKYIGGVVDYKWETAGGGTPDRVGMELNGSYQRIDFVDDISGYNSVSTTNIVNKDVMVEYLSDATTLALKLNGNTDATITHSLTFAPGATTRNLYIGTDDLAFTSLYSNVYISEIMTCNKKLSASELRRVESYLSIKYGLTLGNNQSTGASKTYIASDGTRIWNDHAGYHNYVIGIGRDNAAGNSGLAKTKSISVSSLNGSTDIIAIANSDFTTPVAFTNDKAFFMIGSNAGTLAAGIDVSYTHAGTAIDVQSSRIWCTQKTGTPAGGTNSVVIEVDMALVAGRVTENGPSLMGYGGNANADIRLLVDDNTSFGNSSAGEHVYSPNGGYAANGGKIYFTIPYADIQAGTGYFTIGSVNKGTAPLPIELTRFTATCEDENVHVNWTTATETNNDYFTIESSKDGINFNTIITIKGAGNSSQLLHYSWVDEVLSKENSYYRLKQTDFNGHSSYSTPVMVQACETSFSVFPNPLSEGNTYIRLTGTDASEIHVVVCNMLGEVCFSKIAASEDHTFHVMLSPDKKLTSGIYLVTVRAGNKMYKQKLVVR